MEKIKKLLREVYPNNQDQIDQYINRLATRERKLAEFKLDQTDSFLITYGDTITNQDQLGFEVLFELLDTKFENCIKNVHILPMFPYTSDDGFSVVDYETVREDLGDFELLNEISNRYGLMYDFVVNHMSQESAWFKDYLAGKNNYFIEYQADFDYSQVTRPRTSPLFHEKNGKQVWTTFSDDQIDLNFENFEVFEKTTDILIDYCDNGGNFIRLDAIGFLWKVSGDTCIHHPNTHNIIKVWRAVLDYLFGNKILITETNVPHAENISYFGNQDEAQMVYNFALPPLVANTLLTGNASYLSDWLANLTVPNNCTYFNFLSSHDGIGLRPVESILPKENVEVIVQNTIDKGGKINYKANVDGTKSPYECNINYYSLLKDGKDTDVDKFLTAQFILQSIIGCPAIYIHSMLGSVNDIEGMESSGINRRINREQLDFNQLICELDDENTERNQIFNGIKAMLKVRQQTKAFNPFGTQTVDQSTERIFKVTREFDGQIIECIANISSDAIKYPLDGFDLITNQEIKTEILRPYQRVWIVRG